MERFFFSVDFSRSTLTIQDCRASTRAKHAFFNNRNIQIYTQDRHFLIHNSVQHHLLTKSNEHTKYYFMGRDSHEVPFTEQRGVDSSGCQFPFILIEVNETEKQVSIKTDELGLASYFYAVVGQQLIVTNYFPSISVFLGDTVDMDTQSYFEFLLFGATLPGRTIYKNILMSHSLEDLCFSFDKGLQKIKKTLHLSTEDITVDQVYEQVQKSVHSILQTSQIRWASLTGGSDTRLILSTLSPEDRGRLIFVFDEQGGNPEHIPYDRAVVKMLRRKLNLAVMAHSPEGASPFNHLITGMYGGETLGGNPVIPDLLDCTDFAHSAMVEEAHSRRIVEIERFQDYIGKEDYNFAYNVNLMTNSFMSSIYDDPNWLHPYIQAQKKISPYLNTQLIKLLYSAGYRRVENHQLYAKMFKKYAPELIKFPFFSRVARFNYPDIQPQTIPDEESLLAHSAPSAISSLSSLFHKEQDRVLSSLPPVPGLQERVLQAVQGFDHNISHY